jgi:hypothetical protein
MSSKVFIKFILLAVFGIAISGSNAYAFTCPDSENPEVVSAKYSQMVISTNKSAITVNSGVTVSDGGVGSAYGPVRITLPATEVAVDTFSNWMLV